MNANKLVFSVFNVEFEGIDKCGKDMLKQTMFKVFPNVCAYKARGILSQLAYNYLYNRNWQYTITEGYIQNSLFVKLDLYEDDWLARLKESNEIVNNKERSDVDFVADYKKHQAAFDKAWQYLCNLKIAKQYQDHFLCFNTSEQSALDIAKQVKRQLIVLNNIHEKE